MAYLECQVSVVTVVLLVFQVGVERVGIQGRRVNRVLADLEVYQATVARADSVGLVGQEDFQVLLERLGVLDARDIPGIQA